MQTIGERLEEARKRKGISIREAAETTKIRGDYLQKFEANTFDIDLPVLYIRGFLRAYARHLELDPERIVGDFNTIVGGKDMKPARRDSRENYGRVDFGEAAPRKSEGGSGSNSPAAATERSAHDQAVMMKFGLLAGLGLIGLVLVIFAVRFLFFNSAPKPAAHPSLTEAPAMNQLPDGAQTLTLTAIDATRVKVKQDADGKTLFDGALARGESKSLTKVGKLIITVEAGKNLRVEVNGRNYAVPLEGYGRFALE